MDSITKKNECIDVVPGYVEPTATNGITIKNKLIFDRIYTSNAIIFNGNIPSKQWNAYGNEEGDVDIKEFHKKNNEDGELFRNTGNHFGYGCNQQKNKDHR